MDLKSFAELTFWKWQKFRQKRLDNHHYQYFFTEFFQIKPDFYQNKRILDIGCGPRGSLEWANNSAERIGLDPLANEYLKLGAKNHQMQYINAGSEQIPFANAYFDVVSSFNSLDHVEDVSKSIHEIARILKKDGYFLLITDVGHKPTITEPRSFGWEIMEQFSQDFSVLSKACYEKSVARAMYQSLRQAVPYDFNNPKERYGILSVLFQRQ